MVRSKIRVTCLARLRANVARIALLALFTLLVTPSIASAQVAAIEVPSRSVAFAVEGQTVSVRSQNAAATTLSVTYRPNSKTSEVQTVGNPIDGVFQWTPTDPGLAALSVLGPDGQSLATKNVSVRFAQTSIVGLVVMIFAALVLFGGATISIRALLSAENGN